MLQRLLRLPLRFIPKGMTVPILSGPLRGAKWIVGSSTHGCWLGTYELSTQSELIRLLQPGHCFLDLGANVGFYSLLAARLVQNSGKVYSFEPLPRNCRFLRRHISLNRLENVTVFDCAVSDSVGEEGFVDAGHASIAHLGAEGELIVKTVTLDSLFETGDLAKPDVVKIDVEGAEVAVLRGAERTLAIARPVILLSGHGWRQQEQSLDLLRKYGYDCTVMRDGSVDGMYETIARPSVDLRQSPSP